jgi:hypothetical protein
MAGVPAPARLRLNTAARRKRSDERFFRRWAVTALLIQTLPYLALWILTPTGSTYTGALFSPVDTFRYYDVMLHAHQGAWTFANYFTYVQHTPIAIFTLYTLLGKLIPGGAGPLSLAIAFHLARLLLSFLFIQQAWKLFGEALPSRAARRTAMIFLVFTSGLGVLTLAGLNPIHETKPWDLFFQESSSAFGMLSSPHFAAVLLLLTVFSRALLRVLSGQGNGWAATVVGALSAAALASIHTEKVGLLAVTAILFLVWVGCFRRPSPRTYLRQALQVGLMIGAAVPYAVYAYMLTVNDPTIHDILNQGTPPAVSDPIVYYALGLGIPALCAVWGLPRLLRHPSRALPGEVLLWSMVAGGVLLLVLPWQTIQHRGEGLQIAIAGLAGRELVHSILPRLWRLRTFRAMAARRGRSGRRRLRLLSINLVLILSSTSVMALTIGGTRAGMALSEQLYLNRDDPAALSWLRSHGSSNDVVAAAPNSLPFIAAFSGTHAVWGDFAYTPSYDAEGTRLAAFLTGTEPSRPYLSLRHVTWVYFGPREKEHPGLNPGALNFLTVAYRVGDTVIYHVSG